MPADLNRVTLVGRLTRDPELRHTTSGNAVCQIRLAVTSRGKQGDEWLDVPNYFDVTVFGKQAETAANFLVKGRRIGVDGRLSWREWEAQDGSKRQTVEVVAGDVFFLDSRGDQAGGAAPVSRPAPGGGDSDIPFAGSVA